MTQLPSAIATATNDLVDEHLLAGVTITFTIPTTSMLPTLVPGDQILVQKSFLRELRVGDILLLQSQGIWLAHRLIDRTSDFITKGDNSMRADVILPGSTILGIVIGVRRIDGRYCNLQTRRARWASKSIAELSRAQARLVSSSIPSLGQRILLRASRIILWSIASTARWSMR